ncbi:hypothetical protein [Streptomyces sp. NPDC058632]|uniref:hypothetical protein n=1 Tax=unclassified Streptomyces TaxID=2593676 RepID=UPI0036583823
MNAIASAPGSSGVCVAGCEEPAMDSVELKIMFVGGRTRERAQRGRGANPPNTVGIAP